jgi:hypothetical protein
VESTKGSRISRGARVSGIGFPFLSHEIVGLGPVGRVRDDGIDRRNETICGRRTRRDDERVRRIGRIRIMFLLFK